ncbi:MAG TPA: type II toxin-antitoxin system HipA family toxin YjjJ [Gammaproteobacteria bacterium]
MAGRATQDRTATLTRRLALGPASARELQAVLGVSQPVLSRFTRGLSERLLVAGRARSTRYALRRTIAEVGRTAPVYEVETSGRTRKLATLHAVAPEGFYVEAHSDDVSSGFHRDLPYFLYDLRPSGYLGRLVPLQHPELELPNDVRLWSADHSLRYLTRYGWNLSGALVVGDAALKLFLRHTTTVPGLEVPGGPIPEAARKARYLELADDVLKAGPIGSSAGGEQPKFLATLAGGPTDVIVKFSPPVRDRTSERFADLLVAEHLTLAGMRDHGFDASESCLVQADDRVFLEVRRFDRYPNGGRHGLLSLFALDAEFVGDMQTWRDSARSLREQGHIDPAAELEIRRLELFSQLIANTDRHHANLSFLVRGARVESVAPAYDVAPSYYAPRHGDIDLPVYEPPAPEPADGGLWLPVYEAARAVWSNLESDRRLSRSFRALARAQGKRILEWRRVAERLPS